MTAPLYSYSIIPVLFTGFAKYKDSICKCPESDISVQSESRDKRIRLKYSKNAQRLAFNTKKCILVSTSLWIAVFLSLEKVEVGHKYILALLNRVDIHFKHMYLTIS